MTLSTQDLEKTINATFENMDLLTEEENRSAVDQAIQGLDQGNFRICSKENGEWITHQWLKKAVLLYFRTQKMGVIQSGDLQFFDKIPLKKWTEKEGVRVVPHALARVGSFVSPGAILMPSYVNIGAFVGKGTMVDTWATVGSCAQIGDQVHLSGGVGIGGVLEPLQASPVIIEDGAFIGSRCIIVEGALIEEGAVVGAGVTITSSTKIIDVSGKEPVTYKGRVPKNSVVIPGSLPKEFPAGKFNVNCALIIGQRSESTDRKTSLSQVLRDYELNV